MGISGIKHFYAKRPFLFSLLLLLPNHVNQLNHDYANTRCLVECDVAAHAVCRHGFLHWFLPILFPRAHCNLLSSLDTIELRIHRSMTF
jgi:hypothetical protein